MIREKLKKAREYEASAAKKIADEERPLFHLTPMAGWMNDPNGFSIYKGKVHQFYQYYPYETAWGPMHWGHAVSEDFVKWDFLPAAIAPDEAYDNFGCFSGSAVEMQDGRQMLVYTAVKESDGEDGEKIIRQTQCVAYGDGVDYEKYEGNPVIDASTLPEGWSKIDFRDPKIWWDKDEKCYYLVAGNLTDDASGAIVLYRSEDTRNWSFVTVLDRCRNEYGKMWECPDFFELDGRHVIMTSPQFMKARGIEFHNGNGNIVIIGDYDKASHEFTREYVNAIDFGLDFYAMQTLEMTDGRRIMTAWMQSWESSRVVPEGQKWFGQMILPRELSIKDGKLYQLPVREINNYRSGHREFKNVYLGKTEKLQGVEGRVWDMELEVSPNGSDIYKSFKVELVSENDYHTDIVYVPSEGVLRFDRTYNGFANDILSKRDIPVRYDGGKIKLRILLDRFSVEIFVNDGEQAFSAALYTPEKIDDVRFSSNGAARMDVDFWKLTF